MVFRWPCALLILLSEVFSAVLGTKALANQFPLEIIERFADARIVVYIQQTAIDQSPAWDPMEGAPPLTIEALVKTIQNWSAGDPVMAKSTIRKIELKPIRLKNSQDRWYYLVQLQAEHQDHTTMHYLAVLMNGKILQAIKEPEPYK